MSQLLPDKDVMEKFAAFGVDPYVTQPEQFARLLQEDIQKLAQVVKASGVRID